MSERKKVEDYLRGTAKNCETTACKLKMGHTADHDFGDDEMKAKDGDSDDGW